MDEKSTHISSGRSPGRIYYFHLLFAGLLRKIALLADIYSISVHVVENHRQMPFIYEIPLFLLYFQLREYSNLAEVGGPQISSANPQICGKTFF
jgi:hypothetical protein